VRCCDTFSDVAGKKEVKKEDPEEEDLWGMKQIVKQEEEPQTTL
jgi:hypothetical protein